VTLGAAGNATANTPLAFALFDEDGDHHANTRKQQARIRTKLRTH
jgi:hypothetical protein